MRIRTIGLNIATMVLSCFSMMAQATETSDVYEITLPCQSQSEAERLKLFKEGMEEILKRTGAMPPFDSPSLSKALEKPIQYVELYGYEGESLRIRYSAQAMEPLLAKPSQPTAAILQEPSSTPSRAIVWLAVEDKQQRHVIGQETSPVLHAKLLELAKQRGLPLILPQMDIEDISAVSTNDIWGQFPSVLQQASKRYATQAILTGRIQNKGNNHWQASWQWIAPNATFKWEHEGSTIDALLVEGVDHIQAHFKEQSISKPSNKPILIGISNILSAEDYRKVESYLESLDPMSVSIQQVLGDYAIFEILPKPNQSTQTLMQAIGLEQQLMALAAESEQEVDITYRWVPPGESSE